MNLPRDDGQRPRIWGLRIWPAATVLALAAIALLWIWLSPAVSRQHRVMNSMIVALLTLVLLGLWLLLASGLRGRQRLAIFAGLVGIAVFLMLSVEVREVTGDVVPQFAFKWTPRPDETLDSDIGTRRIDPSGGTRNASGASFPRFLGPTGDARISGIRLETDWQDNPPTELWRRAVGAGNGGFAVAAGLALTQEQRGEHEMVVAYDLRTGAPRWSHKTPTRHANPLSGDGPCATPTIAGDTVFAVGATGHLSALRLDSGTEIWSRNILADADAKKPIYGLCPSPLVLPADPDDARDARVVVTTGGRGALRAYDAATGTPHWSGGDYRAAYASPKLVTLAGTPQIVVFHNGSADDQAITAHDLEGRPLWHRPWPPVERTSQPVALPDDRLFISSGYGVGAEVFSVRSATDSENDAFETETVWAARSLKAKLTQVVYRDGHLYGLDDGILVAVDANTGERAWKRGRYGHGQILLVDDIILILSERGEIALVEASPDDYREIGRIPALEGRTWNTPALAGSTLLVRNPEEAAAFELPLRAGS